MITGLWGSSFTVIYFSIDPLKSTQKSLWLETDQRHMNGAAELRYYTVHKLYLCAYCTHSSDLVTNGQPSTSSFTPGIHMHLKSIQWPLTIIKGKVFDFMKAYDWCWTCNAFAISKMRVHWGYTFYQALHFTYMSYRNAKLKA